MKAKAVTIQKRGDGNPSTVIASTGFGRSGTDCIHAGNSCRKEEPDDATENGFNLIYNTYYLIDKFSLTQMVKIYKVSHNIH
ncbi:MAG: hypothetical protein LBP52_02335 [Burkholderiaceae bacterium]|jgi:hypothetical protein|nr:hypothetical protein [Burkholderiaceae bacterium]